VICRKINFDRREREEFMIDAREEMPAPASHKGRRRPATVAAGRNLKNNPTLAKKSARGAG